jgi:hypothetical protein
MLSGAGLYCDGVIFALSLRAALYEVDAENRANYQAEGSSRFRYQAPPKPSRSAPPGTRRSGCSIMRSMMRINGRMRARGAGGRTVPRGGEQKGRATVASEGRRDGAGGLVGRAWARFARVASTSQLSSPQPPCVLQHRSGKK